MRRVGGMLPLMLAAVACACGGFLGFSDDDESAPAPTAGADAASETAEGSAASPGRFCENADATFCEDFDREDTLPPWWIPYVEDASTVGVVREGRSAPNALATRGTGASVSEAYVNAAVADGPRSLVVETAFFVDGPQAPTVRVQIGWNAPPIRHGFTIDLGQGTGSAGEMQGAPLSEEREPVVSLTVPPWTPGWHHFVADIDWNANAVKFSLDDRTIGELATARAFTAGPLSIELGSYAYNLAAAPERVLFDDVVVRAR